MIWNKVVTGRLFIFKRDREKYYAVELVVIHRVAGDQKDDLS